MKHFKQVLAALLALCMVFCFCACGGNEDGNTTTTSTTESNQTEDNQTENDTAVENQAAFTVKVVDEAGNAVSGVMVQVCKESCVPAVTDAEGVATFNVEITDGYKLQVARCPEGYEYDGEADIYLEDGATDYTITVKAVA